MKVSKRQLKRIIREEKRRLVREQGDGYRGWENKGRYSVLDPADSDGPEDLYVNLTDDQANALDDLEQAMHLCVMAGCADRDIMDTVESAMSAGPSV